jgi:hypothetical protein
MDCGRTQESVCFGSQRFGGLKMRSQISKSVNLRDAVYAYVSVCCSALSDKPSLKKTKEAEGTLGKWRCSSCGRRCSVSPISAEKFLKREPCPKESI